VLDILYYAKERQLQLAEVEAAGFADTLIELIRPKVDGSDIQLSCHVDQQAGTMMVDADYLQAALINILDNAVDACQKRQDAASHQIDFSMTAEKETIVFTITDTGIGMDDETREKMFTLFYSTKERKGTGLGLFIAHRIVSQHGGSISVKSKLGEGTVFTVTLPKTLPVNQSTS
jgi:signal transduction histidine kinase